MKKNAICAFVLLASFACITAAYLSTSEQSCFLLPQAGDKTYTYGGLTVVEIEFSGCGDLRGEATGIYDEKAGVLYINKDASDFLKQFSVKHESCHAWFNSTNLIPLQEFVCDLRGWLP